MRIYLAGPMRGYPQFNFPAFDAAAEDLRGQGHTVFNPADHDRDTYGADVADAAVDGDEATAAESHGFDLRVALGADLAWITAHADAVAVLPGWEKSRGARAEVATALALGLPVVPADMFLNALFEPPFVIPYQIHDVVIPYQIHDVPSLAQCEPAVREAPAGEVRTASSTGGEKGVKPARMGLIPAYPLGLVAEHYGKGAAKYAAHNWRRGYEFSKSIDAMLRHAYAWADGEDNDPELGTSHLAAVVFHAFTLMQGGRDWPQFDDRYKPADVAD